MIAFILKQWKLILDIILVVGAILAFTFFDPFGIFTNTQLKTTANLVTGVRNIGQLVTAEYYGEVISSWKDYKLNEFPEDSVTDYAEDTYILLKSKLLNKNPKHNLAGKTDINEIREQNKLLYYKFIAFLADQYLNKKLKNIYNEKNETLKKNIENTVLKKLCRKVNNEKKKIEKAYKKNEALQQEKLENYIDHIPEYIYGFYDFHAFLINKSLDTRKNKKKNIVFIGRGSVKAGYDFGTLDESNFLYEEEKNIIHFYGIKPVILDTDINPWFIPERKVKGFELVDYSGEVNFEDAKIVKAECKKKLLDQARRADIINKAQENGREALQNFFALILDEPDLKIEFHTHPYELHYSMLASDTLISIDEALFLDTLYRNEIVQNKKYSDSQKRKQDQLLTGFINKLKKLHFINTDYKFNYYSLTAAAILQDSFFISQPDYDLLLKLREPIIKDSIPRNITTETIMNNKHWFTTGKFQLEFNETIKLLKNEFDSSVAVYTDTLKDLRKKVTIQYVCFDTITVTKTDTIIRYFLKDSIIKHPYFFDDFKYKTCYLKLYNNRNKKDISSIDSLYEKYIIDTNYNKTLVTCRINDKETVKNILEKRIIYNKNIAPLNKLQKGVRGIVEMLEF